MSSGHRALPQSWKTAAGWQIPTIGGQCKGQWFRCPEPFDQELPMPNGDHFVLVRNYPGSKYEWCYVERKTLEATSAR